MQGEIRHTGIVQKVSEDRITVGIISESACASCHAKGACTAADTKDKTVEIVRSSGLYHVGQQVVVIGRSSQGFKALFYGYVFPFVLVITTLFTSTSITGNEGVSGILSLSILVPYYFGLFLFRNKLKKAFEFEIKSISNI
ncbi:MAG: SoxR reducing system RseC family protein [Prolixibacteraceae bacterium]|jgi:sigma-E factor negative regulatory protein RseC|nr:SoxR reducing system RseC family protein [Prolixibacteraceae bacterium]